MTTPTTSEPWPLNDEELADALAVLAYHVRSAQRAVQETTATCARIIEQMKEQP